MSAHVVTTYDLLARNGRKIRTATQVTHNGRTIRFTERMGKGEAIRQFELVRELDTQAAAR